MPASEATANVSVAASKGGAPVQPGESAEVLAIRLPKMGVPAGQGWRSEREDAPFHKPNRCWMPGRLMGASPDTRRTGDNIETPGAPSPSPGPRNMSQANGQPAAGASTQPPS
jgi:hypothetical protein